MLSRGKGTSSQARSPRSLRVGLLGAGFVGTVHARAIRASGACLALVAESTAASTAAAAARLGALAPAKSAEHLIESDDIDVVHICTPNALHAAAVQAALASGKHVICEKPLATTLSDAELLVKTASLAKVVATVPFVYRFYPAVREVRARVRAEGAEQLLVLHGSYLQDWLADDAMYNWRVDPDLGGPSRAFADIGVHWFDLLEFTTGHRITRLVARLSSPVSRCHRGQDRAKPLANPTEDVAVVLFETDQGATGSMIASQISLGRKNRLWFSWDGIESAYVFDQEHPDVLWVGKHRESRVTLSDNLSPAAQRYALLPAGHPHGYQDCFNAFVADTYAAVLGERPKGLPSFEDGRRAAALTAAVLQSAESQSWTTVPT